MRILDEYVKRAVAEQAKSVEAKLGGDVAFFFGPLTVGFIRPFRDFLERLAKASSIGPPRRLVFFLNSPGGSAEAAEKMVEIMRHHFPEVFFVIPDAALSAGTVLALSGDRI